MGIAACARPTGPAPSVTKVEVLIHELKHRYDQRETPLSGPGCFSPPVMRKPCSVDGHVTLDGVKWEEDCNTCHCSNGKVVCSKVCERPRSRISALFTAARPDVTCRSC